ncbi:MAG: hypothetical protein EPN97_06090 [Alphaproteobacteria bacterium]|nr:MAG: hypothetical protein EPN97_06090 [Alphaproteobacteria bacterium]
MKNSFEQASTPQLSEAEQTLIDEEVPYERQPDGTLLARGNLLHLASQGLIRLPDLSCVVLHGTFTCAYNKLTSLEGAPKAVLGFFSCYNNQLTSLKGAPQTVGGNFACQDNQLTNLEGAPKAFRKLYSDLGRFESWDAVPENLRISPETRALTERAERERVQFEQDIQDAPVLKTPLTIGKPLRFKAKRPQNKS